MKRVPRTKTVLALFAGALLVTMSALAGPGLAAPKGETLEVLNPFAERAEGFYNPAPRLDSLDGKTIGLLNQNKSNSVYFMNSIEDLLKKKYPNIKFKHFIKRPTAEGPVTWESLDYVWPRHPDAITVATHYHNRADYNAIKKAGVDAVINAVLCCGSNTARSAEDHAKLERLGIPTITVIADPVVSAFETRTWAYGVPQAPKIVIDRGFTWESPIGCARLAEMIMPDVIKGLTGQIPVTMIPEVKDYLTPQPKVVKFEGKDAYRQFDEFFRKHFWSAGLPLVPPTKERVDELVKATKRDPNEVVAVIDLLRGKATIEKIATNAAMAGMKPQEMPVLLAVIKALEDPYEKIENGMGYAGEDFINLAGLMGTANPGEVHVVVAGPIVKNLGLGSTRGPWGPHPETPNNRIGYALRLCLQNIGGNTYFFNESKAQADGGSMTQFFRAEMPAEEMNPGLLAPYKNPWTPLQVTLGYKAEDSVVFVHDGQWTVHAGGMNPLNNTRAKDQLEQEIIPDVKPLLTAYRERGGVLFLSPTQVQQFVEAGYTKEFVSHIILYNTKFDQKQMYGKPRKAPGDFFIVVGGGPGGQNAFTPMGHGHWNAEKIE